MKFQGKAVKYGDNVDTHTSVAHDARTLDTFMQSDLLPFIAGIHAGAPIVMVAHNIVECLDSDIPASLSPAVHRFLREELHFDGIIMTDSLDMGAITLYTGDRASAVQAVLSGNDLHAQMRRLFRGYVRKRPHRTGRTPGGGHLHGAD